MNSDDLITEPIEHESVPDRYNKLADDLRNEESSDEWDIFPTYLSVESKFYPKSWR